jgi:hypothetical protein
MKSGRRRRKNKRRRMKSRRRKSRRMKIEKSSRLNPLTGRAQSSES